MAKRILKKLLRYTARIGIGLVSFTLLYIIVAYVVSCIPVNKNVKAGNDVTIYINTNGVHTDIIVPVENKVKNWSTTILFAHTQANDSTAKYLAFGWGDKDFYLNTPQWSDLKTSTAFNAAFYLGSSAMHTKFYNTVTENSECIKLTISIDDYQRLVAYLSDSFAYDTSNKVQWIANRNYGNYDAFYEAKGKYNLFYTCNTWANNALKAANQKAALWTLHDKGIFYHYKE